MFGSMLSLRTIGRTSGGLEQSLERGETQRKFLSQMGWDGTKMALLGAITF